MAKSTTFAELLEILDFELDQKKEVPDTAEADRFRSLPRTEAPRVINDCLKSLVKSNDSDYKEEIILHFYDSSDEHFPLRDGEYFYIDINECVNGKIFTIPKPIKELRAYILPDSYSEDTQTSGRWELFKDSSVCGGYIYSPSKDKIFNYDGWVAGYEMRVQAVLYPTDLKNSIGPIEVKTVTINADDTIDVELDSALAVERGDIVTFTNFHPDVYDGTYRVLYVSGVNLVLDPITAAPAGAITTEGDASFVADNQIIGIDDAFVRLLTLEIKKTAYSRKNKPMDTYEYIELTRERLPEWLREKGRVSTIGTLNYSGASFGRKR